VDMQEGDLLEFTLDGQRYAIVLDRMVNVLVGADYAKFSIMPSTGWSAHTIDLLLDRLATSDVVFIRDDQEFSPRDAATHLRQKHAAFGHPDMTVDEFIDRLASRSMISDRPYQIRLPDGTVMESSAWFRQHVGRGWTATRPAQ